jgi:hypothetical protein
LPLSHLLCLPQLSPGTEIHLSSLKANLPDKWNSSSRVPRVDSNPSDPVTHSDSESRPASAINSDSEYSHSQYSQADSELRPASPGSVPGLKSTWSIDSAPRPAKGKTNAAATAAGLVAAGLVGAGAAATGGYLLYDFEFKDHNKTKRTFEAFEGRAKAELVERALGDHDLDK